jgi:glycosyltransferase involved in cell wall biosynthesis
MPDLTQSFSEQSPPDLSLVMPCYNEEEALGYTIPHLTEAFRQAGYRLELVAVDNGSTDATGQVIQQLAAKDPSIVFHRVEKNEGYGNGVLRGYERCTAPWVGHICADGQVDAADVVQLFEAVRATNGLVIGKIRRRFRMDGLQRKLVSIAYNGFVRMLWPTLESIDVNGTPKILPRNAVRAMCLESKGWLVDPEIVVKGHYLGLRILEFNSFARMRGTGTSHIRPTTCWEFFYELVLAKFTRRWRRQLRTDLDIVGPNRPPPRQVVAAKSSA